MRRYYSCVAVVALVVACLIGLAVPGVAQVPPGPPLPVPPPEDLVQFRPPNEALAREAGNLVVGQEYAGFDLCRGTAATQAAPGRLNPSDSPCGGAFTPSATVRGGNPPYHFQIEPMKGFPPMGMWVDLNGVLRGKPSGKRGGTFGVCATDMSGRSSCQEVIVPDAVEAGRPNPGGVLLLGLLAGGAGLAYAAANMEDLAATSSGSCISNRGCVYSMSPMTRTQTCNCNGSSDGSCDWTGPTAGQGESCMTGAKCEAGLSCNNGLCEGPNGNCPF